MKIKKYITEAQLNEWGNADDYSEIGRVSTGNNASLGDDRLIDNNKSTDKSASSKNSKTVKEPKIANSEKSNSEDDYESDIKGLDGIYKNIDKKSDRKTAASVRKYLEDNNFNDAAELLKGFKDDLVTYFVKCIGKNGLGDKDNPFINFINRPDAVTALNHDKRAFTDAYNLIINDINEPGELKWVKGGNADNCILYEPTFWTNIDNDGIRRTLLAYDYKLANESSIGENLITEANEGKQADLRTAVKNNTVYKFIRDNKSDISVKSSRTLASKVADELEELSKNEKELKNAFEPVIGEESASTLAPDFAEQAKKIRDAKDKNNANSNNN